jgi:hypothetical protein
MTFVAAVFILLAILLVITSTWRLNWLIVISAVVGIVLLEYSLYSKSHTLDYLSYAFYFCCVFILIYFVESHRITGRNITSLLNRNEFKQYLLESDKYEGYCRQIYFLPMVTMIAMIIFVFVYYYYNSGEFYQLLDFFSNWSKYPSTMD